MEIRKAGMDDLDPIFANRMEFVKSMRDQEFVVPEDFKKNTYEFMKEHIADDTLVTWIAEEKGEIISMAMVSFYGILPVMTNPSGKTGYILNVYTDPEYRRQGIATLLLRKLMEEAKVKQVGKLYLSASDMGRPVYEKLGFEVLTKDMVYKVVQ